MKKLVFGGMAVSCLAVVAAGVLGPVVAQQQQQTVVIQGGTLIDGNGGAPVPNSVVVIQGNRIAAVGRAGQVQVPAGAQTINAAGKWVLPGLIDAKSNWNWPYGEGYLKWGVTSAMVTGTRNDTGIADRDAVEHGVGVHVAGGHAAHQDVEAEMAVKNDGTVLGLKFKEYDDVGGTISTEFSTPS